ncbi:putative lipoprotein [Nautilia profundicola AmH]|uniref:Lipoprotein n=1 Tax=Nautilia profundicola (strain ATCC BAA-1463 / DSM 18972 / AmH) TaxID=598659 RepID=B9L6D3_NAUPA|nr:hypothetical protein [Nautilia profundicola]ACM92360.1 putative lipoprotein [Nautilia profundicola AmH]
MRYILTFILIIFFSGCSKNSKPDENHITKENNLTIQKSINKDNVTIIHFDNFVLKFKNNELVYPENKTVILFDNNNSYSKAQEMVLKKLNIKYYKTNAPYLEKYFNINNYPTIVVLDKNKTVKYENFTPYEILKAEGF